MANSLMRLVLGIILVYRRWISPLLGPCCGFVPSCSAYASEAIARYGTVRGIAMAVWRLLKCHPFHHGGIDPVP